MIPRCFFRVFVSMGIFMQAVSGPAPGFVAGPGKTTVTEWLPSTRQAEMMTDLTGIQNVSCEQARKIIQDHQRDTNYVILDFRTKEMFDGSHIAGAICHDVFSPDIGDWLKALDKKRVYLIYCTLGHRSGIALVKMKDRGFINVLHMHEGIGRWKQLGYEIVSGDGFIPQKHVRIHGRWENDRPPVSKRLWFLAARTPDRVHGTENE